MLKPYAIMVIYPLAKVSEGISGFKNRFICNPLLLTILTILLLPYMILLFLLSISIQS